MDEPASHSIDGSRQLITARPSSPSAPWPVPPQSAPSSACAIHKRGAPRPCVYGWVVLVYVSWVGLGPKRKTTKWVASCKQCRRHRWIARNTTPTQREFRRSTNNPSRPFFAACRMGRHVDRSWSPGSTDRKGFEQRKIGRESKAGTRSLPGMTLAAYIYLYVEAAPRSTKEAQEEGSG